jgi:hypothetical protein
VVLTVSFGLLGEPGLLSPSQATMRKHRHPLDASVGASGPHDFAVREVCALVSRAIRVHRIPLHVRDDRETPLERSGTAVDIGLIWVVPERKYFYSKDWTAKISLI